MAPATGAVAGVTATQPLRITGLAVTPRCIRAPQLRATVAGVRTLGVRFRLSSAAPVRFSLERWKGKRGASACPPAHGKAKADGRRVAGVYTTHSKRAVDARAGVNTVTLAASDGTGKRLRPGTYLLTIRSGESSARVKVWVLAVTPPTVRCDRHASADYRVASHGRDGELAAVRACRVAARPARPGAGRSCTHAAASAPVRLGLGHGPGPSFSASPSRPALTACSPSASRRPTR